MSLMMKKLKLNKVKWSELLHNDTFLKIVAFVMAVFMFVSITGVGSPFWNDIFTTTDYIDSISLNVNYDEDNLVVTGIPTSISVNISGSENDVTATMKQSQNLVGTINFPYSTPGEYEFDTSLIDFNTTLPVNITPVNQYFDVLVQEKTSVSMPIDLNYISGEGASKGYMLSDFESDYEATNVTGGSADVSRIVSVRGLIDLSTLSTTTTSGTQTYTVNLVPYDADGGVVSNVELSPSTVEVSQEYSMSTVELPVSYKVINNNTGYYISSICENGLNNLCSNDVVTTVTIYGDSDEINKLQNVTYQINLEGFVGTEGSVEAYPVLPSGVYVFGDQSIILDITLEQGVTTTIENVPVTVNGLNSTLQAKANNTSSTNINVDVTGAASVVNDLDTSDISLTVDLSDITQAGTYTVPVEVTTTQYFDTELRVTELEINVEEVNNGQ